MPSTDLLLRAAIRSDQKYAVSVVVVVLSHGPNQSFESCLQKLLKEIDEAIAKGTGGACLSRAVCC
jgi:hypothetical protein